MGGMFKKKKPKIDDSAQKEAERRAAEQESKNKKEEAAQNRFYAGRNAGRGLLTYAGTGDAGVSGTKSTLG
jgi:hypothetical protein